MRPRSALADAVINITADTRPLNSALRESQAGVRSFQSTVESWTGVSFRGVRSSHAQALNEWAAQKPMPASFDQAVGGRPTGSKSSEYANAMAAWRSAKPNYAASQAQALNGVVAGVGKLALGATAAAASAVVLASKLNDVATAGSDLEEAREKSGQAFGSHAGIVRAKADENADKYGVAKRETMELASSSGMLLQSAGVDEKQSAIMGANLAQLAAEASSFYNVSVDEAMRRIESGLSGQSRPLREFGVMITEATVSARAFQLGLADASGAVGDNAKTIARYSLITEGLSRAAGDIERSQDRYSMQIRMLQGNLENAGAVLGETFLPAIVTVAQALNVAIRGYIRFAEVMSSFWKTMGTAGRFVFGATHEQLAKENADELNAQLDVDKRNKDLILAANEMDVVDRARRGSGRGAGHTDLAGLYKSIQDAISGGGKDALIRDQVQLQKRALEEHKKVSGILGRMLDAQKGSQGGKRF